MIDAYAGELNQVWTNLIDNAVNAMEEAGTLRITTQVEADDVVIDIGDTGVGMSPEVAARAFEAFYTTKDVGQDTGLGLDIAHRIVVERHGGTIMIDSRPGETIVRVRLPSAVAAQPDQTAVITRLPVRRSPTHSSCRIEHRRCNRPMT
jgi:signal transduction histidine kinase